MGRKFGTERYRPRGDWVQTTLAQPVVGIPHRRRQASAFASAVARAEAKGWPYGVTVEPEPTNPHDPNAIRVIGMATVKPWFRAPRERHWHIGYVAREMAEEIQRDLLAKGVPIEAELYSIYRDRNFLEVKVILLAPKGHSESARRRRKT